MMSRLGVGCGVVCALLLSALLLGTASAADAPKPEFVFGQVQYPALGNIKLDEGTIEYWVTPCFNPYEKTQSSWWLRAGIFGVYSPPEQNSVMEGSWAIKTAPTDKNGVHSQMWVSFGVKGKNLGLIGTPALDSWGEGKPLHFAMTWKGKTMAIFVDGKSVGTFEQPDTLETPLPDAAVVFLGNRWGSTSLVVIDELRVSSVARKAEELGFFAKEPLKADAFTLLLDHFDDVASTPDGKRETKAEVMAKVEGRTGGRVLGGCRQVEGKFGKGMALFTLKQASAQ